MWDEFLERTALRDDLIETGFPSVEGATEARKNIKKTCESS